jgi:uncharacterized protein YjeT (DUF2065 family)
MKTIWRYLALILIGEGIILALLRRKYLRIWRRQFMPREFKQTIDYFLQLPILILICIGVTEAGIGWLLLQKTKVKVEQPDAFEVKSKGNI